MFDDLIQHRDPPPNRVGSCTDGREQHLTEGAVQLAFAMHLLRTVPGLFAVSVHPDGEHLKHFDFRAWLEARGFAQTTSIGTTACGGTYTAADGRTVTVNPKSGLGDVVARMGDAVYVAECRGGVINSRHAGQLSRLRRGLCEVVGLLLASPNEKGRRQFAVVPRTLTTETLAARMAHRAGEAGIEIALVDGRGNVTGVPVAGPSDSAILRGNEDFPRTRKNESPVSPTGPSFSYASHLRGWCRLQDSNPCPLITKQVFLVPARPKDVARLS